MTDQKPPLLWHSNAPWAPTGYGQQTALFAPLLAERYDLGISSFYGLEGARLNWNGILVYPGLAPDLGDRTLLPHAKAHFRGDVRAGIVVTLFDVWAMRAATAARLNTACWVPVDHDPAPPRVLEFFADSSAIPIAMSRFGQERLEAFDPLYVPHAVDTKIMHPIDQREAREKTKLPQDRFIVGMVSANKGNPSRKAFPEAILAFAEFHRKHPEAALYLHTEGTGIFGGVDLASLIREVGLPSDSVYLADQERILFHPFPQSVMAEVFSSLDVLLNPSTGEGFGVPIIEANACGVPAIVTDFSASPEVNSAGWTVEGSPYWTTQDSWQRHPVIGDIADALGEAIKLSPKKRQDMSNLAKQGASKYDLERVWREHMIPALDQVEERIAARQPKVIS